MNHYLEDNGSDNMHGGQDINTHRPLSALMRPPFNAEAVRMAALEHARRYLSYYSLMLPDVPDNQLHVGGSGSAPSFLDASTGLD